jgi:predicted CXXCH cytochrome family protein
MPHKGDLAKMRKGILLATLLTAVIGITGVPTALAAQCGGVGYTGTNDKFCLQCHTKGCPVVHPTECKVIYTKCISVPPSFPTADGHLTCTTCHDMTSKNRYFLRSKGPLKNRFDFCFECHNPACYRKFNPHKTIASKLPWEEKKKACIYCHGVGAELEAYKACVGCHTETPHVGAPEHLFAKKEKVAELVKGKAEIVDINSMKELKPKIDLESLERRKPKMILVKGKIACITCHNPHPQIAIPAPPEPKEWAKVEKKDLDYKLEKLRLDYNRFKLNVKGVKLMSYELQGGKLCQVCHTINSLK